VDLRPHKQAQGIPASYPSLSYDELLAKFNATRSGGEQKPSSLFGGLFKKTKPEAPATSADKPFSRPQSEQDKGTARNDHSGLQSLSFDTATITPSAPTHSPKALALDIDFELPATAKTAPIKEPQREVVPVAEVSLEPPTQLVHSTTTEELLPKTSETSAIEVVPTQELEILPSEIQSASNQEIALDTTDYSTLEQANDEYQVIQPSVDEHSTSSELESTLVDPTEGSIPSALEADVSDYESQTPDEPFNHAPTFEAILASLSSLLPSEPESSKEITEEIAEEQSTPNAPQESELTDFEIEIELDAIEQDYEREPDSILPDITNTETVDPILELLSPESRARLLSRESSATESSASAISLTSVAKEDLSLDQLLSTFQSLTAHAPVEIPAAAELLPEEHISADSGAIVEANTPDTEPQHQEVYEKTLDIDQSEDNSFNIQDLMNLFDEAEKQIISSQPLQEFSIPMQAAHLTGMSEQLELLFDLAQNSIENPETVINYIDTIEVSSSKTIESIAIETQIAQFEQAIDRDTSLAQTSTLHNARESAAAKALDNARKESPLVMRLVRPSIKRRFSAACIDFLASLLAAILIAGTYIHFTSELQAGVFAEVKTQRIVDILGLLHIFLCAFVLMLYLFPFVCYLLFRSTPGTRYTTLRLVGSDRYPASKRAALARSIMSPLSLVTGGWIPALWGYRPLHEALSGAELTAVPTTTSLEKLLAEK
jgi:hypothetical protein